MAILAESQRQAVARRLEALEGPVELELFVRDTRLIIPGRECPRCEETVQLLEEVCTLSPHLRLTVRDLDREADRGQALGVQYTPTLVIHGRAGGRVRFVGAPLGYEFASLLEVLAEAGRAGSRPASPAGREAGPAEAGPAPAPDPAPGQAGARPEPGATEAEARAGTESRAASGPGADGAPPAGEGAAGVLDGAGPLDPERLALLEAAAETVHLRVFFTPT
ncbi:hypothetical protein JCM13210_19470 [Thermaerobacter litoralis]